MARVTWRCQPVQERTSYSSSPTSPFAASKQASIVQRVPATRTSVARSVASGASVRWKVSSSGSSGLRRTSSPFAQPAGAPPRQGRYAQSWSRGPLLPSPALSRSQPSGGTPAAHASTRRPPSRWPPVTASTPGSGSAGPRAGSAGPAARLDPAPQGAVGAVDAVPRHPRARHAGVQRPLQHRRPELRLGGERDRRRHASPRSPRRIARPALGQVEGAVDQRPAVAAGVTQEDADLAILDAARGAAVLPLHADRLRPLLHEPGLVQHQHGAGIAEVLDHVGPQIVPNRVGVPPHPAEEVPHPVRRAVARRLGQPPAVLAPHRRQQPAQVRQRAPARLRPPPTPPPPPPQPTQ